MNVNLKFFLKDTIRKMVDFSKTAQNRGLPPPPLQKPYPLGAELIRLAGPGQWQGVREVPVAQGHGGAQIPPQLSPGAFYPGRAGVSPVGHPGAAQVPGADRRAAHRAPRPAAATPLKPMSPFTGSRASTPASTAICPSNMR